MKKMADRLRKHFRASFEMLKNVPNACPDHCWETGDERTSIWKRILHTCESVDYWMSDEKEYLFEQMFPGFSAEMDLKSMGMPSKGAIIAYIEKLQLVTERFFDGLDDTALLQISLQHEDETYLDIIICQIRHIQTNIGYCSEVFRRDGTAGVAWLECR